jgi:hypothetical protein
MNLLIDCPTCGGLLPVGRNCCPHCHCKTSSLKKISLVAAAVIGLGGAGCNDDAISPPGDAGMHTVDASASPDLTMPGHVVEYGPAIMFDASTKD